MNRLTALLALAGALFATACDDQPTSPRPGQRPSAAISDAANGGANSAVYFLPPITERPTIVGTFNPNLTSAVIRVCHIVNGACDGDPVASFGLGQETGPIVIGQDHYLAVWHTAASEPPLIVGDEYQIQVFTDDPDDVPSAERIAWVDVQAVNSGRELKNLRTNEIVGLLPDGSLPIKVWLGTEVRCLSTNCVSQRVTDVGGTLILESGNGALLLQDGWLPPGVSEVTVTLQRHDTGPDNDCVGKAAFTPPGLVAQREACLQVTTDPVLVPGPTTGIQRPAFIFVCTESSETDLLRDFLQIIKADDGRPLQALKDVDDDALIAQGFVPSCEGTPSEIGFGSHPLLRLASRGLRAITRPVARLLEVKALYAIDLGQGGEIEIFDGFSYFTLGVQASAAAFGSTPETAPAGEIVSLSTQVTGLTVHPPGEVESVGLPGIDVTFTITDGVGGLTDPVDEGEPDPVSSLTVQTNADGVATVNLSVGLGTNVVEAVAMVDGEPVTLPVTFTVAGTAPPVPAGSVVIFKDIDAFNNAWVDNPNNTLLVQNLIGFSGPGPRAAGDRVVFDHGKTSLCGAEPPFSACAGFSDVKAIIGNADYFVDDVVSSPTSTPLADLAPDVKVVFLVAPQSSYTVSEINGLKQFASEGGRIVYLGDYCIVGGAYCGGVATQDALMSALGASITHVSGLFSAAGEILPASSIQPHEITTGMTGWQTAGVGAVQLGAGATALIVVADEGGPRVVAAVAPVDVTPIEP